MTRIEADWLTSPETQDVLAMLVNAGHQAFVVGGAVRNAIIGKPVTDIDIATSAVPDDVVSLAKAAGFHSVPTGIDHGTVTVVVEHRPFEVTTFRRDIETDGRRAVVAFSGSLEEDAARRDFTMNALYADADGLVTDPVGGFADLKARRVVFVGDPNKRIEEDHLRSLRFFRFLAEYGDAEAGIDPDALAAVAVHLDGLSTLARERVGAEMAKLLAAPDPAPALAAMQVCGALLRLLPGATADVIAPLVHLEAQAGVPIDWVRRLAAMGVDDAASRLRISKKDARRLEAMRDHMASDAGPVELAWREGRDFAWSVALLRLASLSMPIQSELRQSIEKGAMAEFPVAAEDFMPSFSGPALGRALTKAERLWLESDLTLSREDLLKAVGNAG